MKRVWMVGFVLALLLSLAVTTVTAAQRGSFSDANGDGVCDYAAEGCADMRGGCGNGCDGGEFIDEDCDGVCDNFGVQQGKGCGVGNGTGGNIYGGGKGCGFGKGYCGGR